MNRGATLRERLTTVFGIDPRSLALFRVLLGTLLLIDLALRSRDLAVFYTDAGVLPRRAWGELTHRWHLSLHAASGELWWQILLFGIAAIAATALLVGYRTRLATLVSVVLLGSLMNRNGLILQGGDQLLVVMCFWALFLPLGMRFSFDAALTPTLRDDPNAAPPSTPPYAAWFGVASVAVTFQVLYLYFFTALLKTGDAWRSNLDAAFYALSLQHFATPIGEWMAGFPLLLKGATVYVLFAEFVGPVLVLIAVLWWRPTGFQRAFLATRLAGLALLASLHVAFVLMLHIGLFPFIDFMSLSLLIPGALWVWLGGAQTDPPLAGVERTPPTPALTLHYDVDCGFCLKMCLILREFLLPAQTPIVPAQDTASVYAIMQRENSWVVTDADGTPHVHWHAMALIFRQARPVRWLGRLMSRAPFIHIGNAVYRAVANNRDAMSRFTARWLPWREVRVRSSLLGSALAAFAFYVVTSYNVWELPALRGKMPAHVEYPARMARIDQRWDMFAPYPLTVSIYPLVRGTLRSGEFVDLHELTSSEPDWQLPGRYYELYDNYRWRKYLGRVDGHRNNAVRRSFGEYQCRRWNTPDRAREQQLGLVEVTFVKQRTNTDGLPKQETRRLAWRHWCYPEFKPKPATPAS